MKSVTKFIWIAVVLAVIVSSVVYIYRDNSTVSKLLSTVQDTVESGKSGKNSDNAGQKTTGTGARILPGVGKTGKFTEVASRDSRGKLQFLDDLVIALQKFEKNPDQAGDYFKDMVALSAILSQLALDSDKTVSAQTLTVLNLLSWTHIADMSAQPVTGMPDISHSAEVKSALDQLVLGADTDDNLRASAISAHSFMYPPEDTTISEFGNILTTADVHQANSIAAVMTAFEKYRKKYNYEFPATALEATRKLVDYPSDSVKARALSQLSISEGKSFLPELFEALKKSDSYSLSNETIMNILLLDQSDETVKKLQAIAATSTNRRKAELIKAHTDPGNIERLRKMQNA